VNPEPRTPNPEPDVGHWDAWVRLAVWQAEHVAGSGSLSALSASGLTGDKILDVPLAQVGGKALFVKDNRRGALGRQRGLAVHSMKDVPTDLAGGLVIAAIPGRETRPTF